MRVGHGGTPVSVHPLDTTHAVLPGWRDARCTRSIHDARDSSPAAVRDRSVDGWVNTALVLTIRCSVLFPPSMPSHRPIHVYRMRCIHTCMQTPSPPSDPIHALNAFRTPLTIHLGHPLRGCCICPSPLQTTPLPCPDVPSARDRQRSPVLQYVMYIPRLPLSHLHPSKIGRAHV